jgi:hypothetical protein
VVVPYTPPFHGQDAYFVASQFFLIEKTKPACGEVISDAAQRSVHTMNSNEFEMAELWATMKRPLVCMVLLKKKSNHYI